MEIQDSGISDLVSRYETNEIIGLTRNGNESTTFDGLAQKINENSCVIIGGFQKGHFNQDTEKIINETF